MRFLYLFLFLAVSLSASGPMVTITDKVETDFGIYRPIPVRAVPGVDAYTVGENLENIANLGSFTLTAEQQQLLLQNGFFVTPLATSYDGTGYNEMYDVYIEANLDQTPIFVTSDVVLHVYHRFFDYILQSIEENKFYPQLISLDEAIFQRAMEMDEELGHSSTFTLAAYFAVALKLLNPNYDVPAAYQDIVGQEVALIEAHQGYAATPLFQAFQEDYSQYKPRGHYTKSEVLKRFFKVMMWHGRMTFVLRDGYGNSQPGLTGSALLLTQILADPDNSIPWDGIYQPTVFFVGKSDDHLYLDYLTVAEVVYGSHFMGMDGADILEPSLVQEFIDVAEETLPEPEIGTETSKGLRFMGQRFIPDSLMLDRLVYPHVDDRFMPLGLDVMAVLGSEMAFTLLEEAGETAYPGYMNQMNYLKERFESYPAETWAQNLYWNWLYSLMPLLFEKGEGYPIFMQNDAWTYKDLNASLGSWAELRHDTILYAKQSASGTGINPYYYTVWGYVEPNPGIYARLAALSAYTLSGLDGFGLTDDLLTERIRKLHKLLLDLKGMAEKELQNELLSYEEGEILSTFGLTVRDLVTEPQEYPDPSAAMFDPDRMPVIADVHTDPNSGTCLEEGVGFPTRILVAVPVGERVYLTVGASFSYYEFTQPMSDRLTDEQWMDMLMGTDPPVPPSWTAHFRDSAPFDNPQPVHTYSGVHFQDAGIVIKTRRPALGGELALWMDLHYEEQDVTVSVNGVEVEPVTTSGVNGGIELLMTLPDETQITSSILDIRIGFPSGVVIQYLLDLSSTAHSRPF